MPRRVSLPNADDLFRPTVVPDPEPGPRSGATPAEQALAQVEDEQPALVTAPAADGPAAPSPTGRVRHDEKMTVYISSTELLDLEDARLSLRRRHGLAADRGRLVRAAVALALADLEQRGEDSDLVTLLRRP